MRQQLPLIFFSLTVLFYCQNSNPPPVEKSGPQIHIKTAVVRRMDMVDTVRIYGEVKLRQEAQVASQFDGRLSDFSLLLGDKVKKGEMIGVVIPPEREALLQTIDKVDNSLRPMLQEQIKSIPLISPIEGVILDVLQHSGDVLQKGETIIHIGDLSHLDVHGDLPIQYLPLVRKMKNINVLFVNYPHPVLSLPIKAISGRVDEAKQTVAVRLSLVNLSSEFKPGMLVQLIFPSQVQNTVLTIPRTALLEEEGVYSAFVVKGNLVEKRNITIGILNDNYVEVQSGLSDGETVATQKAYSLIDGMEVFVE